MSRVTRRKFLTTTLATAATITIGGTKSSARVMGANDRIRIAIAGLNGRGGEHVGQFMKMKGVEIVYLVDPDKRTYQKRLDQIAGKDPKAKKDAPPPKPYGPEPKCLQDIRKALE